MSRSTPSPTGPSRVRLAGRVGIVAAVATLTCAAGLAPAYADTSSGSGYVALGDSYAAGEGGGDYLDDGTKCDRSPASYPNRVSSSKGLDLDLQACSGAVIGDLTSQYGALGDDTELVTVSAGGNDIGFAPVITDCAKPAWWGDCGAAVDDAERIARNTLPSRLDEAYATIRAKAPNAKVVVTGYPRLFNGQDCSAATFFSAGDMQRLNGAADTLDGVTRAAAARAGFGYVDVRDEFEGHQICDSDEWIHNLSVRIPNSFHPKPAGYSSYATEVTGLLGGSTKSSPQRRSQVKVRTGGQTSSDTTRGKVGVVDLTSPSARAAARKAGISQAEVDALAVAQTKRADQLTGTEKVALQRAKS